MKKLEFNLKTVLVKTIAQADVEFIKELKLLVTNRSILKSHVNTIKESFEMFGTSGATINVIETKAFGKLELFIVDGQHRTRAAIEMGLPLNVNIVRLEDDTKSNLVRYISVLNNTSRGWVNEQYLTSFRGCGLPIYNKLGKLKDNTNLKMTDIHFIFLNNNSKLLKEYKQGLLQELPNEEESMKLYNAILKVWDVIPNKAFTRRAFYKVYSEVKDKEKFVDKVYNVGLTLKLAETSFSENEQEFKNHLYRINKSK